jgi:hypothetical protein
LTLQKNYGKVSKGGWGKGGKREVREVKEGKMKEKI